MALNGHPDRPGPGDGVGDEGEFAENGGSDENGSELLPCGRELSAVWDAWDDRGPAASPSSGVADPHLVECPHCSAALADLAALGDAVDRTRAAERPGPSELSDLTARVMDIVRLELRPGRSLPLGEPDEDLWIVEAAAARAFRGAAESLPGVRAGSCRISPRERGPVRVRLEVAAGLHLGLPDLADEIRARVAASARDTIGIEVESIDVFVVDLFDAESEENADDGDDYGDDRGGRGGADGGGDR
ncbi:hypothetical protein [Streptomyces sp. NPDC059209]|uniref:hypothetical protein n=1 Tax=Streptomyces sp. NPDC059209 TaxID=3346769 RepID=UPI0036CC9D6F